MCATNDHNDQPRARAHGIIHKIIVVSHGLMLLHNTLDTGKLLARANSGVVIHHPNDLEHPHDELEHHRWRWRKHEEDNMIHYLHEDLNDQLDRLEYGQIQQASSNQQLKMHDEETMRFDHDATNIDDDIFF